MFFKLFCVWRPGQVEIQRLLQGEEEETHAHRQASTAQQHTHTRRREETKKSQDPVGRVGPRPKPPTLGKAQTGPTKREGWEGGDQKTLERDMGYE